MQGIRLPNTEPNGPLTLAISKQKNVVVKAATKHGQPKDGVQHAPEHLLSFCLSISAETLDPKLLSLPCALQQDSYVYEETGVTILRPQAVSQASQQLYRSIFDAGLARIANGNFPRMLVLGGDHSIAIGSVSAISNLVDHAIMQNIPLPFSSPDLVVFWIDAHGDINTPMTTSTGRLHGCPVSLLAGIRSEDWTRLTAFDWLRESLSSNAKRSNKKAHIDPTRLAYIGIRDLDLPEAKILQAHAITQYSMSRVKELDRNIPRIIQEALQRVDPEGIRPIHISFDIDAIDPQYAGSTGTPAEDGLLPEEGVAIIKCLGQTGRLISMDVVEVNPFIGSPSSVQSTLTTAGMLIGQFKEQVCSETCKDH